MKKLQLLITDKVDISGLKPLEKYFKIDIQVGIKEKELEKIIGDYECVITRSSTGIPKELIEKGKKLKMIGRAGIGVDNIDVIAATGRKIAVINAPKGNARVTAEHTIGLIFSLLRYIPAASQDLKKGIWNKQKYVGSQLHGKTLGIVGFGNVGKEVFRIARGIGMKVVVCEPYIQLPKGVGKVTFEELLKSSDVISFHVPLTYLTRGMINKKTVYLCKKGAYIINCSRGGVVEERAIYDALKNGYLAGFAVDVFAKEPPIDSKLLKLPQVIATPHIAGSTFESQRQSVEEVVTGIIQYLDGELPGNLLNPQVFRKPRRKADGMVFDAVIFDCDSTLTAIEGIDEMASLVGKKEEVAFLTRQAMEGRMSFVEAFEKRLDIVKPNRNQLLTVGELYIKHLIEDAKEIIEALKLLGKQIYIVSGAYTPALLHLGKELGMNDKNIFGNDLLFDEKGNYQSYIGGPLRRNHGKLQIIRRIEGKKLAVGDAITDLETKECVELFVGFGGVTRRIKVEQKSEVYLYCRSMAPVLVLSAGVDGCIKLLTTKYRKHVGKGVDLLFHNNHVKVERNIYGKLKEFRKLAYY